MSPKYPQNLHTPKILIVLKTQTNIEIQDFEPPKLSQAYVWNYPITPLGLPCKRCHPVFVLKGIKASDIGL